MKETKKDKNKLLNSSKIQNVLIIVLTIILIAASISYAILYNKYKEEDKLQKEEIQKELSFDPLKINLLK